MIAVALSIAAIVAGPPPTHVDPAAHCWRVTCKRRVARRAVRRHWRHAVRAYGPWRLRARVGCESASAGGYRLSTTGNGFWFAHQFTPQTWHAAGGRISVRLRRPVGAWTTQPTRLEQDYRAVVADAQQGDPWPNCP